ncbi:phage tail terminator-like protein [Bradyrhizobium sp. URHD0069]|uniref:phage tail terminator-like protein n=1 Tax=Bradyrhizobium sp. URHD0069 TaxID=1380355 RepID=UPI0004974BE1|nr:phage tail terminator-like protein [Bradyrhizobium sp. URHD0069]
MPDPVEVAIESALLNRAIAFAAAQSPALTISLPNIAFTPPPDKTASGSTVIYGKWLKATFLPAPTLGLGVSSNSTNQLYGLLQIDVFHGIGAGEYAPGRIASAILSYFKFETVVTKDGFSAKVWKQPYRSALMTKDAWTQIPVTIPYVCFAPNPA